MALSPNLAAVSSIVAQNKNRYAGMSDKAAKPKDGRTTYRVIPAVFGSDPRFWRDLGVHWIKAQENGKPLAVIGDSEVIYGKPSLVGAAIEQAIGVAETMDEATKKLFTDWRSRKSVLLNVVNRDEKDSNEVLEVTVTTFGKIIDLFQAWEAEGLNLFDPQNGCDIQIIKNGKGLQTTYDVGVAPVVPGRPHKPLTDEQIARAQNLDDFIAKNYFRESEQKALAAIAQIAGIRPVGLGAALPSGSLSGALTGSTPSAASPTPSLVSPHAAVPGANAAAPDPAEEERKRKQAEIAEMQRKLAAAQAEMNAPASAPTTPAPAQTPAADPAAGMLSEDDLLSQLENL